MMNEKKDSELTTEILQAKTNMQRDIIWRKYISDHQKKKQKGKIKIYPQLKMDL